MSFLDKLAAKAEKEVQDAQERQRKQNQAAAEAKDYDATWKAVEAHAGVRPPKGKSPAAFYRAGEAAIRKLAAVLRQRGWEKYLPAVFRAIEQGQPNIAPCYEDGELAVAELLRLAGEKSTRSGTIARELRRLAEREPRFCGLAVEVDNVRFFFMQCYRQALAPPEQRPVHAPKPTAPTTSAKGVAPRNAWFLQQYEAHGSDTFHKPAKIQDKWWTMTDEQRADICPASPGKVTKAAVVIGIKRARKLRDPRPKPAAKRQAAKQRKV